MSTQLINPRNFNAKNIVFSKNKHRQIPNSEMTYQSINMSYRNDNGSVSDFVITTPVLYSSGIRPNYEFGDESKTKLQNYTLGLFLHSNFGATPEEEAFEKMIRGIDDACKSEIVRQKVKFDGVTCEPSDVRRLTCLKYPKDKITKEIKSDATPRLYIRILDSRNGDDITIRGLFYDTFGKSLDPLDILEMRCRVKAVIKVNSIFIGAKIMSIQLRVQEAYLDLMDNNIRPMLSAQSMASEFGHAPQPPEDDDDDDDYDDTPAPKSKKKSPAKKSAPPAEETILSDDDYSTDDSLMSDK